MTAFVLAWTSPGTALDPKLPVELQTALAPAGNLTCFATQSFAVASWDSAIWPGPSVAGDERSGVVVAGDPVVRLEAMALDRQASVALFQRGLLDDPVSLLRCAEGTFAGVAWGANGQALVCTDKLGVRPIYWAQVGTTTFASTTQWALKRITQIPNDEDLRGIIEASVFGAPLANRTFRTAIQVLGAGELLDMRTGAARVEQYWDWTRLPPSLVQQPELATHVLRAFNDAVAARIDNQRRVFAFLSGGMDSRLIVGALRGQDVEVSSLNFAPPGSQDLIYGRMAAEAAGTQHFEFDEGGTDFATRRNSALRTWDDDPVRAALRPLRSGLVWSGDGGSVSLGHVYLNDAVVSQARKGDITQTALAIQAANYFALSPRSFSSTHQHLARLPIDGIREDLASRPEVEPGRNAHLFFMLNDQRRHLAAHFESLHEHRIDLILPFFDGRFLATVLTSPIDPFLMHRLYNEIMASLPFGLGRVPWQCYPGHAECPVRTTVTARHQWTDGWYAKSTVKQDTRRRMRQMLRLALSSNFPSEILSRPALTLAALLGVTGSARFGYLWNPAQELLASRGGGPG